MATRDWGKAIRALRGPAKGFAAVLAVMAWPLSASAQGPAGYRLDPARPCAGLPRIAVQTPPGLCIGLAAQGIGFPRGVLAMADGSVLVADMGGWERGRGRLLRVYPGNAGSAARVEPLLRALDRPHGLIRDGEGRIWMGEANRISEVVLAGGGARLRPVLTGAPANGRHPLIGLAALSDGRLAFSTGSATDACERGRRGDACAEAEGPFARAALRVFTPRATPVDWKDVPPYALGLRNALALTVDPESGGLWAADNGTDLAAANLPPDELNRIDAGRDYGWPACMGRRTRAPGFAGARCASTAGPALNLAAHSAPLGMAIVDSRLTGGPRGLAIALHGPSAQGGRRLRLVALSDRGEVLGRGTDLVWGWGFSRGLRPTGTPVGLDVAADGSLWITEDGNGTLLRLARD